MAEEENNKGIEPTKTDVFQQQKQTIDTLIDVLERQGSSQSPQVIYSPQVKKQQKPATNYVLIAAVIAGLWLLTK